MCQKVNILIPAKACQDEAKPGKGLQKLKNRILKNIVVNKVNRKTTGKCRK